MRVYDDIYENDLMAADEIFIDVTELIEKLELECA